MDKVRPATPRNSRPTLGLLVVNITRTWGMLQWRGVADAARERGVNLVCLPGGELHSTFGFDAQANVLHDLVDAERIDGLMLVTAGFANYVGREEVVKFCARYRPLPIVSVEDAVEGIPSVLLDNYQAMREVMVHLIEAHGYRRIAYIQTSLVGRIGFKERYRAYTETLTEYGIPFDPSLVSPPFDQEAFVNWLQAERAAEWDALVGHNDWAVLDAVDKLQSQGIRVPKDLAVAGFDDMAEGRVVTPPLTTARPPFYEMGWKAVETLLALIEGEEMPEEVVVPSSLVVRQSCGCLSPVVTQAAALVVGACETVEVALAARREEMVSEMVQAVGSEVVDLEPGWAERLLDAFSDELQGQSSGAFLSALEDILRQVMAAKGDVAAWQNAVSALRRLVLPYLGGETLSQADGLWQQARVLIGEVAERARARQELRAEQQAQTLREIGQALSTTFDTEELANVLARQLPRLDIPSCYLSLYEDPAKPAEWSRLMLAYGEADALRPNGRIELEAGGIRFPSRQLVPEGMLPQNRPYSMVVEPLYFREHQLGFVLFEAGPRDGRMYDALRGEISSALQGALLVRRVQERSAELARQQYVLDTFVENVPDPIYFKDLDSRITRANKAHAINLGLSDLAEEIGKSDFDFFPEELARAKHEQEQAIIRTGQPVLNLEESDGMGRWALTTKMPLRDENGNIIGTFGISRDITERKRAEEQLERYSAELAQSNEELKRFTYIVSHDVRAPLVNLKGFAAELTSALNIIRPAFEPLLSQTDDLQRASVTAALLEDMPEALGFIDASVTRMDHFVSALLNLSRLGRRELDLERINMEALVQTTLETLAHQIEQRQVQVTVGSLPELVADRTSLEQILGNILNNAILYLEPGRPGEIEITGERNADETIFRIRDNGRGIAPEDMDKVFAPFRRAGKQDVPGEGMGLAYVQTLVRRHGGRIWCESEPGAGTTFAFALSNHLIKGNNHV